MYVLGTRYTCVACRCGFIAANHCQSRKEGLKREKKTLVSPMGFNRRASSVEKLSRANDKPFYLPFTIDVFSSAFPETSFNLRQDLCWMLIVLSISWSWELYAEDGERRVWQTARYLGMFYASLGYNVLLPGWIISGMRRHQDKWPEPEVIAGFY